jgi:hypothetical protein
MLGTKVRTVIMEAGSVGKPPMLQTTTREKGPRALGPAACLRIVRRAEATYVPAGGARHPAWAALYVIVILAIVALFGVDRLLSEGVARTGAQLVTILSAIGFVRIWLQRNRTPLARMVSPPSHRA